MKAKTSNIISVILLAIAFILLIANAINIADVIHEYNNVSDMPNTSGVDWLAFAIGLVFSLALSVGTMAISFFTFFLGRKKYLKIISAVFFILSGAVVLVILIYRFA